MPQDPIILLSLLTVVAMVLFAMGIPIFLAFGVWAIGFHFLVPAFGISNVAIGSYELIQSFPFVAIPLFLLTGDLIYEMGEAKRLINFAESLVGWMPGSTGNTAIVACGVFSAITGSNVATTASVGKALYPELTERGYDSPFAGATVAAGGILGGIIPPSVIMIIYGSLFNVSISSLFLAGVIPGFIMLVVLISVNTAVAKRNGIDTAEGFQASGRDVIISAWGSKISLGAVILLLGGIFSGIFTPTEAATVAVAYILVMGVFTNSITFETVHSASTSSILIVGIIVPIIVMSILIQQDLSYLGALDFLSSVIINIGIEWVMVLVIIGILLLSGAFLNSVPNVVLMAPILAPAAYALEISPLMWGIIFLMSDQIGFITPPYGLNLYIISGISGDDYIDTAAAAAPYLLLMIVLLALIMFFPEINFLAPID